MTSEVPPPMVMRRVSRQARETSHGHVAGAAVELEAAVDDAVGELAADELGHRDLAHRVLLPVHEVDRAIAELTRSLGLGFELHDLGPHGLEAEQAPANGLPSGETSTGPRARLRQRTTWVAADRDLFRSCDERSGRLLLELDLAPELLEAADATFDDPLLALLVEVVCAEIAVWNLVGQHVIDGSEHR